MKKICFLLLVSSLSLTMYAQENTDTKTKIKEDKAKTKDADGKLKVKANAEMNTDGETKTKVKNNKLKVKDGEGKIKSKGDGGMNNAGMGNDGMNTSTNTNVIIINGWRTDPATLPVVGSGVSAEVVTTLKNKYGANIYDIKQLRSTSGQDIYVVRVMENGGTRTEYVSADGSIVSQ